MRLDAADGTRVELRPTRYQFGNIQSATARDWDANWLEVRGEVHLADGRQWRFEDPCLTTWEARDLGAWLRRVLGGVSRPTPFDGTRNENVAYFTEPNLALSLVARDAANASVRFHFSHESAPPWLAADGSVETSEFFVQVTLPVVAWARAVEEWDQELTAFPVR